MNSFGENSKEFERSGRVACRVANSLNIKWTFKGK